MNEHIDSRQVEKIIAFQKEHNCKKLDENKTIKCNICGYESEYEFLPYKTRNTNTKQKCPNCYALKRTRLLYYVLEHYTDYLKHDDIRILQTSPTTSLYKRFKSQYHDNYTSSDIQQMPQVDEIINLEEIPYPDNTFDLILSKHVLEHVPDYPKALREIYRVLKPGGKIIFLIPSLDIPKTFECPQINTPELRSRYYRQFDHLRYFGIENVYKDLEDTGFDTIKNIEKKIPKDDMIYYLLSDEPVYIGIKPEKPKNNIKNIEEDPKINLQTRKNYCSLCENENPERFKDTGSTHDYVCLNCYSRGDDRLIYNEIYFDINEDSIILNFNSSEAMENKFKKYKNYNKNIPEKGFIQKTKLKTTNNEYLDKLQKIQDKSVDFIISNHFLDRQVDDFKILREFNRILKSSGKLLIKETTDLDLEYKIEAPEYNREYRRFFMGNHDTIKVYGKDLLHMCHFAGFNIEYEDPEKQINNLQSITSQRTKAPLIICTKK